MTNLTMYLNMDWGLLAKQKADLRVRKDVRLDVDIDPKREFLEELGRSVRAVLAFLFQNGPVANSQFELSGGDARLCSEAWGSSDNLRSRARDLPSEA